MQAISPHGDPLTYSASGLPDGLSLNTSTGLITGTLAAAAADDDPHTVTLTVTDGTHSSGTNFDWTVPEVVVVNPGTQETAEGDTVDLAIYALDANEDELTYGAEGLPPGLAVTSLATPNLPSATAQVLAVKRFQDTPDQPEAKVSRARCGKGTRILSWPERILYPLLQSF